MFVFQKLINNMVGRNCVILCVLYKKELLTLTPLLDHHVLSDKLALSIKKLQ